MVIHKTAFVFPGQGSQSVGMLKELADISPLIKETFQEASDILHKDLWKLSQVGPEIDLNKTEKTQPVLLAASVAVWRVWQKQGGRIPAIMAGHSLGEYTALVCAESLTFPDAVRLVTKRARLMQAAVPKGKGSMLAIIGLDDEQIKTICKKAAQGDVLSVANYNAIDQIVLAGTYSAIERASEMAKHADAKLVKVLPISVPSHCALMQSASQKLETYLQKIVISSPKITVVHNVDVCAYQQADKIRTALIRQLNHSVHWVETIQYFAAQGVTEIIECGPGKVLTGLTKRIDCALSACSTQTPASFRQSLENI